MPEVDPDRCVHTRVVDASCRACVDACPHGAWVLAETGLGLATALCDGCAICVAACPPEAITLARPSPAVSPDDTTTALVACEVSVAEGGTGVLPCLNAIGLDELAALHHRGIRRLVVAHGDCDVCARHGAVRFDTATGDLQKMLIDRGLPPLEIDDVPVTGWQKRQHELARPSRRSLFNAFRPTSSQVSATPEERKPAAVTFDRASEGADAVLVPHAVVLDPATCEACDACTAVCPTGALTLRQRSGAPAQYVVDARHCTGCRLCLDVCRVHAVSLEPWQRASVTAIDLDTAQCAACGSVYRIVAGRSSDTTLCRICSVARHSRNLFQVLP